MAGRKNIYKDAKPFTKNDPRINKKGAPKTKDLKEKIQAALDNPGHLLLVGEYQHCVDGKGQYTPGVKPVKGTLVKVKIIVPNETIIILKMIQEAGNKGNVRALEVLWNRIHGLPKQSTEITNPDGSLQPKYDLSKLSDNALKELINARVTGTPDSK